MDRIQGNKGLENAPARAARCEADQWRPSGDGQRSAIEAVGEEQAPDARMGETVLR